MPARSTKLSAKSGQRSGGSLTSMAKKKPLLIFINPISGTGGAEELFTTTLRPALQDRKIPYEVVLTDYAGHAREIVRTRDLSRYCGVVTVAGDGTITEIFSGLRDRGVDPVSIPVGVLPGGSGCALCVSLLYSLEQEFTGNKAGYKGALTASNNVAKGAASGNTVHLDLLDVELANGERWWSFLGVTLGVIADGDIGTEWMRWLGFMRVYLYVAWRTLFPWPYKARVSYLPLTASAARDPNALHLPPLNSPLPEEDGWVSETDEYHVVYALNLPLLDPWTLMAPDSRVGDGVAWIVLVRGCITRLQLIRWFLSLDEGPDFSGIPHALSIMPVKAFRVEPLEKDRKGFLTLDGDSVYFGAFQGQLRPGAARLLADPAAKIRPNKRKKDYNN